jgi:excisionase family DNA binding protein
MDELLIDVKEAARRISLGRTEVYGMVLSGELTSIKRGRRRLIAVTDLEAWVAAQRSAEAVNGLSALKTARKQGRFR